MGNYDRPVFTNLKNMLLIPEMNDKRYMFSAANAGRQAMILPRTCIDPEKINPTIASFRNFQPINISRATSPSPLKAPEINIPMTYFGLPSTTSILDPRQVQEHHYCAALWSVSHVVLYKLTADTGCITTYVYPGFRMHAKEGEQGSRAILFIWQRVEDVTGAPPVGEPKFCRIGSMVYIIYVFTTSHGMPWDSFVAPNGIPWDTMGSHGMPRFFHEIFHGTPWDVK